MDMRRRLSRTLADHPQRAEIDAGLTHLFMLWFNRGFLTLQRIDWQTSAVVLGRRRGRTGCGGSLSPRERRPAGTPQVDGGHVGHQAASLVRLTVNYGYRPADLERNHDGYANQFRVASSKAFRQLMRASRSRS
jgi:hypothetical protein